MLNLTEALVLVMSGMIIELDVMTVPHDTMVIVEPGVSDSVTCVVLIFKNGLGHTILEVTSTGEVPCWGGWIVGVEVSALFMLEEDPLIPFRLLRLKTLLNSQSIELTQDARKNQRGSSS